MRWLDERAIAPGAPYGGSTGADFGVTGLSELAAGVDTAKRALRMIGHTPPVLACAAQR